MKLLESIWSWLLPNRGIDSDGRVKCTQCRNRVLQDIATENGGLCGVCFRRKFPRPEADANQPSEYHQKLNTPVHDLDENGKRSQLSGAIAWGHEERIDELLAGGPDFMSKPARYSSRTWLGEAIYKNCSLSILKKLVAAGGDVNSYLDKSAADQSYPLEIAIDNSRIDVMEWLLANGANPNLGRPIVGAIHYEKSPNVQLEMLTLLIEAGANINKSFDLYGDEDLRFTALDWAELYEIQPDVIDYLKSNGATKQWTPEKTREMQRSLGKRRIVP